MKKILLLALVLVFIQCKTTRSLTFTKAIDQSQKLVETLMQKEKVPGLSIAVSHQGKMVWAKGFGYSDVEAKTPVDPLLTKFRIGSVSKPYTTAALAMLFQEGKIDLDAPIQQYVPYFPKKEYEVTIRQLGGHLGGIRHYQGFEFMSQKNYPTVKEGIDIFKDSDLIHEPGSKYAYSSYGWNLISSAIESASEEDFLTYIQKTVFTPLKMKNTSPDHAKMEIANRTKFYLKENGEVKEAPFVDNSYKWAGGGFLSTAEDMLKFGNAHLKNDFLKKETLNVFLTNQKTNAGKLVNYGIGWRIGKDKKDRDWFGHGGGSVGGTTYLVIYPKEDLVVTVTTNMSNVRYDNLPFKVANQFLTQIASYHLPIAIGRWYEVNFS